jgi:hypothetical protein
VIRAESTISSDNHTPFSIAWITSNPASPMAKASRLISGVASLPLGTPVALELIFEVA